ncbi:aldolase/citrate lyase family protein [Escherichia coli]
MASTCYPPEGIAASPFLTAPIVWHRGGLFRSSDQNITILVQIESQQGVGNVDAIAATEGVDGIFVGPAISPRH